MSKNENSACIPNESIGLSTRVLSTSPKNASNRILLEWFNLTLTVNHKNKKMKILKGVSGFANPGQILAIMGSSGSGKTSLSSIISNQILLQKNDIITGTVSINGVDAKKVNCSNFLKYVMQQDIVLPTLTPREALTYAARLKISGNQDFITKRVNHVLKELKLTKVADALIGNEMIKGLSGGEKKRICIGLELISEPNILILDEPTSGLDSFTAEMVIKLMKQQAEKGKTIILTIHQPSSNIFNMFDRLILMVEGCFAYQGCRTKSLEYFSEIGYRCPDLANPPDYYMRILFIKNRDSMDEDENERFQLFKDSYYINEEVFLEEIDRDELAEINTDLAKFQAGYLVQISVLLGRSWKNNLRNPMMIIVKLIQSVATAVLVDIIFYNLGYDTIGIQNRKGVLFFSSVFFVLIPSQTNSTTFPLERPSFLKEYKEGLYEVTAYLLAKLISDLPFQIITTFIYSIMIYFVVDFNSKSSENYFIFFSISLLQHLCGAGYGNMAGAFSIDTIAAIVWGSTIAAPLIMFGGYLSNVDSLSKSFYWIKYVSAYYYGFTAYSLNEFRGLDIEENVADPLKSSGIDGEIWEHAGGLLLLILGCTILSFCSLKFNGEYSKLR